MEEINGRVLRESGLHQLITKRDPSYWPPPTEFANFRSVRAFWTRWEDDGFPASMDEAWRADLPSEYHLAFFGRVWSEGESSVSRPRRLLTLSDRAVAPEVTMEADRMTVGVGGSAGGDDRGEEMRVGGNADVDRGEETRRPPGDSGARIVPA